MLLQQLSTNDLAKTDRHLGLDILVWQRLHIHARPKVWNDMVHALTTMSVFFGSPASKSALSEMAAETMARIADSKTRAKDPPNRRTCISNPGWPQEWWEQVDAAAKEMRRTKAVYHRDWDIVVRPSMAQWYRAGVIAPAFLSRTPGVAVAITEPGRNPDVYFYFRRTKHYWPNFRGLTNKWGKKMVDPYEIDLLTHAKAYSVFHQNGRFALLRVWSHPHFWPLMPGPENRFETSFEDSVRRS